MGAMGEVELSVRLAAMVGTSVLLLGGVVWRDEARYNDGALIAIGYGIAVCAGVGWWSRYGIPVAFALAAVYRWRRNYVRLGGRERGFRLGWNRGG